MEWITTKDYYIGTTQNFKFTNKCACFDLDGTLITTKSNRKFPKDKTDWKFLFNNVKEKLTELINKKYCIIIISNQSKIKTDWIDKINDIHHELNIDIKVFCSISHNKYRKPLPSFYREFIPCKKGFYCGDACGRENDFSDSDYKFALNCNLLFKTPEELFLQEKQIVPTIIYPHFTQCNFTFTPNNKYKKEIVIMVGYPASGKSYIADQINKMYDYKIINQDISKTKSKMLKQFYEYVNNNESIIIDNTNLTPEIRKTFFIDTYTITCIFMDVDVDIVKHNNMYRCVKFNKYIPELVYKRKLIIPTLEEGFDRILNATCGIPDDPDYLLFLI